MRKTAFLLSLLCLSTKSEQKYNATCSNSSQSGLTFEETTDGVPGRYKVEWCTTADRNVTNWELVMHYIDNPVSKGKWGCTHDCENCNFGYRSIPVHSFFNEKIHLDFNCTNVCFSTNLDLIFNDTCYQIKTFLQRGFMKSTPDDSVFYKRNNYIKDRFIASKAYANSFSTDEELVVLWHLDIPATDYTIELCRDDIECGDITNNCTIEDAHQCKVRCALAAPFGNYTVTLQYQAAWTSSELFQSHIDLYQTVEHRPPAVLAARGSRIPLWWLCVIAAVAVLVALLLLHSYRSRLADALRQKVLHHWLDRVEMEPSTKPANNNEVEEEHRILLLYARDCAQFARVAELLRALLAEATGCRVVDLYSADTVREAARAPGEWLQRALSSPSVRVVLLQSPAAALHAPAPPAPPADNQPLLVPTVPHSSDWLLTLALRRLAETGHVGLPYRKYFVAEIAGLEADVLPHLTRLRRYSLPAAARLLVRDLAPDAHAQDTRRTRDTHHTHDTHLTHDEHCTHDTHHTHDTHLTHDEHCTHDTHHTHHTHHTHDTQNTDMQRAPPYAETLRQLTEAVDELTRFVREQPDYMAELLHAC